MVEVEEETSNSLFETLAEWNEVLKDLDIDFEELSND